LSNPRPSLLERISGPNAVPLTALVKKGEAAAEKVQAGFGDYLGTRLRELADVRYRLSGAPDAVWDQFYSLVVDLRGSAAMAGGRVWAKSASLWRHCSGSMCAMPAPPRWWRLISMPWCFCRPGMRAKQRQSV
jgi:hypothetical protein